MVTNWKCWFLERGAEVYGEKEVKAYEKKIAELVRMVGQKEVEIALLRSLLRGSWPWLRNWL
jgi:hypothetical protein